MKGKGLHHTRRIAHALRFAGFALIAASLGGAALRSNVPAALAAPLATAGGVIETLAALPISGSPAPSPSPSPTAGPASAEAQTMARGGPVTFGLSGNLAVGERMQQSTFGTGAPGGQNQATSNAGLL